MSCKEWREVEENPSYGDIYVNTKYTCVVSVCCSKKCFNKMEGDAGIVMKKKRSFYIFIYYMFFFVF